MRTKRYNGLRIVDLDRLFAFDTGCQRSRLLEEQDAVYYSVSPWNEHGRKVRMIWAEYR
jgi:hypothetical protein